MTIHTWMWPVARSTTMRIGQTTWIPWKKSAVRRRSRRSAMIPPARMSSQMGASVMNESRPSRNGEFESRSTSHGSATCCIHVPVFESRLPNQRSAKSRERSARRALPLLLGAGAVGTRGSDTTADSTQLAVASPPPRCFPVVRSSAGLLRRVRARQLMPLSQRLRRPASQHFLLSCSTRLEPGRAKGARLSPQRCPGGRERARAVRVCPSR
jgi:hypothetical protein